MASPAIILTKKDYEQLSQLVARMNTDLAAALEEEINRAELVEEPPSHVVTMNSVVTYLDLESGKESRVTLVYPQDADLDTQKISVLAPIGAALIGLPVGQEIEWPLPNNKFKRIRVLKVDQA